MSEQTKAETKSAWDLEAIYDAEIAPLMTRIVAICKEHRLPMFASFAYANNLEADDTAFCTTALPFEGRAASALIS